MKFNMVEKQGNRRNALLRHARERTRNFCCSEEKNFSKKIRYNRRKKIGSVDNTFIPNGENEQITVPDGIAHFS
ncbi:MAG: hypothetical protein L6V93_16630 [Clostridiales bacterium]|nr:MAG: hypothetical protein L6V93_16630 [Clostridiales bacterium]